MIFKVNPYLYPLDYSKYSNNINEKYIEIIKKDDKNKMIISCIDNDKNNITSFIIYRKIILKSEIKFIILLIGVHEEFRNNGYGKIILDEFVEYIKQLKTNKIITIIVHPLDSSEYFFINYGFVKIEKSRFLKDYEGWKLNSDKLIYKLCIMS